MFRCLGCMREYSEEFELCPFCGYVAGTAANARNHLAPGTLLANRYVIGKSLGQGGFGITYIAWDSAICKEVSIKEYMPNAFASRITGQIDVSCYDDESQNLFYMGLKKMVKESQCLARFNELDGVVDVFDCFEANNTAYIVMELLHGRNVNEILNESGRLTYDETVSIISPILQALNEIHKTGLIHRDIAPDNIFVCNDGSVKLLDFGSARVVNAADEKSLSVVLKRGFAPKEQYTSRSLQGSWTDVYAASATIYKMLTGETPTESLERQYDNSDIEPLFEADIPPYAQDAILRGMAINAEDRIQTAGELLDALTGDVSEKEHGNYDDYVTLQQRYKESDVKNGYTDDIDSEYSEYDDRKGKGKIKIIALVAAALLVAALGVYGGYLYFSGESDEVIEVDGANATAEENETEESINTVQQLIDDSETSPKKVVNDDGSSDQCYYDSEGRCTLRECRDANGVFTKYIVYDEYDSEGRVIKSSDYDKDEELTQITKYEYNTDGNEIKRSVFDSDEKLSSCVETQYKDGKASKKTYSDGDGTVTTYETFTYSSNGTYTVKQYDGKDLCVKTLTYDKAEALVSYSEIQYGNANVKSKEIFYDAKGVILGKDSYEYNVKILSEYEDPYEYYMSVSSYDAGGVLVKRSYYEDSDSCAFISEYNKSGVVVKETFFNSGGVKEYVIEYNSDGSTKAANYYDSNSNTLDNREEYKDGNLVKDIYYTDGDIDYYYIREFDARGNVTVEYEYDANDNLLYETHYDRSLFGREKAVKYDANGRIVERW